MRSSESTEQQRRRKLGRPGQCRPGDRAGEEEEQCRRLGKQAGERSSPAPAAPSRDTPPAQQDGAEHEATEKKLRRTDAVLRRDSGDGAAPGCEMG